MTQEAANDFIKDAPIAHGESWADLGCGKGIFSYALAEALHGKGKIYALDKEFQEIRTSYQEVLILFGQVDFTMENPELPGLDGIFMANSLHYVNQKERLLRKWEKYFKPSGKKWLIIEYEDRLPGPWVPYPISFLQLKSLFSSLGYHKIEKIRERKSVFGGKMYLASVR